MYINDDTGLTMTYFTARSNLVACTFELGGGGGGGAVAKSSNGNYL